MRLAFTNTNHDAIEYVPYVDGASDDGGAWIEARDGRRFPLWVAETVRVDPWARAGWIPGRARIGPSRVVTLAFVGPPPGEPMTLHLRGVHTGSEDLAFEFVPRTWMDVDYETFRRYREAERRDQLTLSESLGTYTERALGEP